LLFKIRSGVPAVHVRLSSNSKGVGASASLPFGVPDLAQRDIAAISSSLRDKRLSEFY
jgi:hypothetical protein